METNFTNALDKICTQQASMLDAKFQTMENIYTKNMKAYGDKFSKVLDRLDKVTENWTTVERENAELKCKISNLNHTTTLKKELLKSELDS